MSAATGTWRGSAVAPAVAAIAFGLLGIGSAVATGHPPMPEKSVSFISAWYHSHREGVYTSQLLLALAVVALLWFVGHVRSRAQTPARSVLAVATATTAALFVAGGWLQFALAVGVNRPGESLSPSAVRVLSDLSWAHWAGMTAVATVLTVALCLAQREGTLGARWVSVPTALSAVLSGIGAIAAFYPNLAGKQNPLGVLGFIGFLLFCLSVLLTGVTMLAGSRTGTSETADTRLRAGVA